VRDADAGGDRLDAAVGVEAVERTRAVVEVAAAVEGAVRPGRHVVELVDRVVVQPGRAAIRLRELDTFPGAERQPAAAIDAQPADVDALVDLAVIAGGRVVAKEPAGA